MGLLMTRFEEIVAELDEDDNEEEEEEAAASKEEEEDEDDDGTGRAAWRLSAIDLVSLVIDVEFGAFVAFVVTALAVLLFFAAGGCVVVWSVERFTFLLSELDELDELGELDRLVKGIFSISVHSNHRA